MPRKQEECKCEEGLPGWLATFADLMSLLLTFFVLLLSFANMDIQKFQDMLGSIKDAFGVQVQRKQADYIAFSPSQFERKDISLDQNARLLLGMVLRIKAMLDEDRVLKKNVDVTPDDQGVLIRVNSGLMFEPGSAKLKPEAAKVLERVIKILKEYNFDLIVRGHTDDRPVRSGKYPSNWELSAARAAAALRYIVEKGGINPSRLKAVGYADTRPLVPNNSESNRAINRRVEFYYHRPKVEGW
ncbi:flagellar motor protein MotB [Desulfohalobiaceae bacterium Ax17]|jgi:chemotaxis protein MotB|uniref:OmpA/MotB family protein n=1 Tax=Desulfovulcanus ferrireducens TaxID=2831190 RepID=UPI00207BA20A|nr:flagellar motor protein MotB [Desulfovulcanus ferrireducens]MBT8764198.1 flagellar motor protein MotB [Desulfovulcanus ferrireducens]